MEFLIKLTKIAGSISLKPNAHTTLKMTKGHECWKVRENQQVGISQNPNIGKRDPTGSRVTFGGGDSMVSSRDRNFRQSGKRQNKMGHGFTRYALYFLAAEDSPVQIFGDAWLGWSVTRGKALPHPQISGLPMPPDQITATPRKYGFHGTLKPPFRLAANTSEDDLVDHARLVVAAIPQFVIPALQIAFMGQFLALVLRDSCAAHPKLASLASTLVEKLDHFRAPLSEDELRHRRSTKLTAGQDALLARWGYPYVMDEFRFHMTLTGRLNPADQREVYSALQTHIGHLIGQPVRVSDIGLVGEAPDGQFHLISRLAMAPVSDG
ncbi:MAG: DUF1045 domain-containing protein [Bacteroidetes bacterium]|nr:DUF1045 domain-containing protein [Bacteroidota bacterium]